MATMASVHRDRRIGDLRTPPVGFGAMLLGMEGRPDEARAMRTLHAALDAGVRLVDTAVNYGSNAAELGFSEALVARALASWGGDPAEVLVVCKGGNVRTDDAPFLPDGSPANLRRSCETSLRALGVESIGLYLLHLVDPHVPLSVSIGALAQLRDEGKIQHIGISNVGRRQLAEAQTIVDIVAVEDELSPWSLAALPVARTCEEQGIAFLAYSPLGSRARAADLGRAHPEFAAVARERNVSPQQVALAWLLGLSPVIVPIPSARRPETILDSVAAACCRLTGEQHSRLSNAVHA
jgi:aryl-alcohol dehydrogenase-like predicted oxidoreductase